MSVGLPIQLDVQHWLDTIAWLRRSSGYVTAKLGTPREMRPRTQAGRWPDASSSLAPRPVMSSEKQSVSTGQRSGTDGPRRKQEND
jgi:hypothetical protein